MLMSVELGRQAVHNSASIQLEAFDAIVVQDTTCQQTEGRATVSHF